MKKILSVFMALCTVLTTLCIPPAPVTAQSSEMLVSDQINETVTLPAEEEPITLETLTEDCKILQYVDEEAFEAADHAFRLPELEELDTYVFQNEDGTRSIYYLYENVKYIDEQGNIREKDNTLQREIKGFRITENEFDLLLPHAVTDGVELAYQGYDVKLIPATEGKLTATAPGTLQDNSVVYESFFGAGTSLVYTPLLSGVKEEIILEEYLPNKSFSFLLYTDGLFLNNTDGSYILTESKASAEAVLYLGDIVVYDAIGRPGLGNLAVETVKDGTVYALTVSADEDFLADPATVYPVTIDPDLTISDANNGSGAIEDTTVFNGTPNLNTGDWVYNTAGYVDETYGAGRILVRLPGLYNSTVFQGLTADRILSATFYTTKSSSKTPDYVHLYRCTNASWSETTATWNNAANLYAAEGSMGTSSASSSVVSFDITTMAKAWRNYILSPSAGFMLINQNETDVNKKFGIYASEHSNTEKRPYFVLNYSGTIWLDESEISIAQGKTRTLIATTDPAGGTVRWNSSNEAVATVSAGVVSAHAPGFTTITAIYVDGNGQPHTAECVVLVWLPSDTYTINNGSQSKLLQLPLDAYTEGSAVYGTNGVYSEQNRGTYFKINHLGNGVYSIRSMLDNSMGLKRVGNNIVCGAIGTSNDTVPDEAKWAFGTDFGGTFIYSYNGSHTDSPQYTLICAPSFALIDDLFFQSYSAGYELQTWTIAPVAANCEGVTIWKKTDDLAVGDTYTFKAAVYSTNLHEHGGGEFSWVLVSGTQFASLSSSGTLFATSVGTVTLKTIYTRSTGDTYEAEKTVYVIPLEDGVYFLKNRQEDGVVQIDDDDGALFSTNGAIMEMHAQIGEAHQRWKIVSLKDGYYKIISEKSGLALSVKSGEENSMDVDLVQEPYVGAARQQWQFIATTGGAYKIKSRSSESDLVICVNSSLTEDEAIVQQGDYENDNSYLDEWVPVKLKDRAIVIVPGITCSSLQNSDGEKVWAFFQRVDQIACKEDGKSKNLIYPYNPDNAGVMDYYENIYGELTQYFGSEYDIIFFAYDWRMSCAEAALKLQERLSDYESCILVAHSMGGVVASSYLSISSLARTKVEKLITIGTPFTGAPKAMYVIETGRLTSFTEALLNLSEYALNIPAVYELLPTQRYFEKHDAVVGVNNSAIRGYANYWGYIKTLDWAKKSDGTVKPMFADAEAFHSSVMVNGTHAAELTDVDVYKIVGRNEETIGTIIYDSNGEYKEVDYLELTDGDGTVPIYSALNNEEIGASKTYYFDLDHVELITDDSSIECVISIIEGSASSVQSISTQSTTLDFVDNYSDQKTTIVTKGIASCTIRNGSGMAIYVQDGKAFYDDEQGAQHCVGSVWYLAENAYQYLLDGEAYTISEICTVSEEATIRVDYCSSGLSENLMTFTAFSEGDLIQIQQATTQITTKEGVSLCRSGDESAEACE